MPTRLLLSLLTILLAGCGPKPVTKVYPAAHERPITCLRLAVFPQNRELEEAARRLYPFRDECPVLLEVKHKENICCNSTQNVAQKTLSAFPHHFLRLEVRRGMTPLYSYYIDLDHPSDTDDLQRAFERMEEEMVVSR
jgi:uncharacterized protein YbaR (Trm112 family)